jgi:alanyl-tRNA synthetase
VDTVVASFGGFYPELRAARDTIYDVIREEEASFSRTLVKGIEKYKKAAAVAKQGVIVPCSLHAGAATVHPAVPLNAVR